MIARLGFLAPVVLCLIFVQFSANLSYSQSRQIQTTEDSDYFGFDLETQKDVSLDQCKASCLGNQACLAFTYNTSARFCFLKSDFSKLNPYTGAIAGRVISASSEPDLGAPPKLSFLPSFVQSEAHKFRNGLNTGKPLSDNARLCRDDPGWHSKTQ